MSDGITGIIEDQSGLASNGPPDKRKRDSLSCYWSFRFTFEKVGSWDQLISTLKKVADSARFQHERGDKGQNHYQGVFHIEDRKRVNSIRPFFEDEYPTLMFPDIDYLRVSRVVKAAERYVMKEETRIDGPWEFGMPQTLKLIKDDMLYKWQKEIIEIIKEEPDNRSIYWFWGGYGIGKTQFCKYLSAKYGAIPLEGEKRHIFAVVMKNQTCKLFIMPLCKDDDKPSYRAIEKVKDGYFMSHFGTENTGPVVMNSPHIIIFANCEPDYGDKGYHPDKYIVRKIPDERSVVPSIFTF